MSSIGQRLPTIKELNEREQRFVEERLASETLLITAAREFDDKKDGTFHRYIVPRLKNDTFSTSTRRWLETKYDRNTMIDNAFFIVCKCSQWMYNSVTSQVDGWKQSILNMASAEDKKPPYRLTVSQSEWSLFNDTVLCGINKWLSEENPDYIAELNVDFVISGSVREIYIKLKK
jgi:hypothetical protein